MRAITLGKALFDSVGHYARPDLLRLGLDSSPHHVVEPLGPALRRPGGRP